MKKIYNSPNTEVVKIEAVQLLNYTSTININGDYDNGEGITTGSRGTNDWGGGRNNFWDDDE